MYHCANCGYEPTLPPEPDKTLCEQVAGSLVAYGKSAGVQGDLMDCLYRERFLERAIADRIRMGESYLQAEKNVRSQINELLSV